jgi:hypothetical protein
MKVVGDATPLLLSYINRFSNRQEQQHVPKYNRKPERKQDQPQQQYHRDRDRLYNKNNTCKNKDTKGKGKEVNQVEEDSEYHSDRSGLALSSAPEEVNFVSQLDYTCARCGHIFDTTRSRIAHENRKLCLSSHATAQQSLSTEGTNTNHVNTNQTCCRCHEAFDSRNKLF